MHSGVPQGPVVGPLLLFLFVIHLPDGLEAPKLLFKRQSCSSSAKAADVKMVTQRTLNLNLHSSLITAWLNPAKCNYRTIGKTFPV